MSGVNDPESVSLSQKHTRNAFLGVWLWLDDYVSALGDGKWIHRESLDLQLSHQSLRLEGGHFCTRGRGHYLSALVFDLFLSASICRKSRAISRSLPVSL